MMPIPDFCIACANATGQPCPEHLPLRTYQTVRAIADTLKASAAREAEKADDARADRTPYNDLITQLSAFVPPDYRPGPASPAEALERLIAWLTHARDANDQFVLNAQERKDLRERATRSESMWNGEVEAHALTRQALREAEDSVRALRADLSRTALERDEALNLLTNQPPGEALRPTEATLRLELEDARRERDQWESGVRAILAQRWRSHTPSLPSDSPLVQLSCYVAELEKPQRALGDKGHDEFVKKLVELLPPGCGTSSATEEAVLHYFASVKKQRDSLREKLVAVREVASRQAGTDLTIRELLSI